LINDFLGVLEPNLTKLLKDTQSCFFCLLFLQLLCKEHFRKKLIHFLFFLPVIFYFCFFSKSPYNYLLISLSDCQIVILFLSKLFVHRLCKTRLPSLNLRFCAASRRNVLINYAQQSLFRECCKTIFCCCKFFFLLLLKKMFCWSVSRLSSYINLVNFFLCSIVTVFFFSNIKSTYIRL